MILWLGVDVTSRQRISQVSHNYNNTWSLLHRTYPRVIIRDQPISIAISVTPSYLFDIRVNGSDDLTGGKKMTSEAELREIRRLQIYDSANDIIVLHLLGERSQK